jgi:glycosyltransferase involved in cell wall biosynthesis
LKILHHDFGRHAFPVQLSRTLAARGHSVLHLYAGSNNTPMGNLQPGPGDPPGFECRAIDTGREYRKYSYIQRWRQERAYAGQLAGLIRSWQPDVVLECTGPTDGHRAALAASRQAGARYVYWLQDVNGVAAYNLLKKKIPVLGAAVGRYYINMERSVVRGSDRVVLISEDFDAIMREWNIPPEKCAIIPNWAPLEHLPEHPRVNAWSTSHGLRDSFCFMYTGSLGLKHNPGLFVELARRMPGARVVVLSEGLGAGWLCKAVEAEKLPNLTVMGYAAFEDLPDVLASADVLVSVLQPDAGVFSVPSKVNTYLCAGRPLLLAVPAENLASRLVTGAGAGLAVDPADVNGFVEAARKLFQSEELRSTCGRHARDYAESHFNIETITDSFEEILRGEK